MSNQAFSPSAGSTILQTLYDQSNLAFLFVALLVYMDRFVYIISPFCSDPISSWFSPGRARKLSQVAQMLLSLRIRVCGLNTAPMKANAGDYPVIRLCSTSFFPLRIIQIIISAATLRARSLHSAPIVYLWLYNTRFTEAIVVFILLLIRIRISKIILEFEDLPCARRENAGIRGFLDFCSTKWLVSKASFACSVSPNVTNALNKNYKCTSLPIISLPPLLDSDFLARIYHRSDPFTNNIIKIVYAGGYTHDKGVDMLIEAFLQADNPMLQLQLYGPAPQRLISSCASTANIIFFGVVPTTQLYTAYSSADIVVNPHRIILNSDFVFPFKLAEIFSCGALPLSTPVPGIELYPIPVQCIVNSTEDLRIAIGNAKSIWNSSIQELQALHSYARERHSIDLVRNELGKRLKLS